MYDHCIKLFWLFGLRARVYWHTERLAVKMSVTEGVITFVNTNGGKYRWSHDIEWVYDQRRRWRYGRLWINWHVQPDIKPEY